MSLCYNPTANTITVSIIKARNLKAMDIGGTSGTKRPLVPRLFHFSHRVAPSNQTNKQVQRVRSLGAKGPGVYRSTQVIFMAALIMIRVFYRDVVPFSPPADPYVKVWLMHKDKRVEKKKTVVMKRCLNPVFNESFPFDVPAHVLRETTIIITVMDKDKLSRNDVIGKVSSSSSFSSSFSSTLARCFPLLFNPARDGVTAGDH